MPFVTTLVLPEQRSLAVAPGSVKGRWHSLVMGFAPSMVTTGGVLSRIVRVATALVTEP